MENVTLNQKEQARLQVLNSLLAGHMTIEQASTLMGVSMRHAWRMLAAYRREGAAALAHGHRGRRAPNAILEATKAAVLHLARTRYAGTNHTHMSELLREHEGIDITRSRVFRNHRTIGASVPSQQVQSTGNVSRLKRKKGRTHYQPGRTSLHQRYPPPFACLPSGPRLPVARQTGRPAPSPAPAPSPTRTSRGWRTEASACGPSASPAPRP